MTHYQKISTLDDKVQDQMGADNSDLETVEKGFRNKINIKKIIIYQRMKF